MVLHRKARQVQQPVLDHEQPVGVAQSKASTR